MYLAKKQVERPFLKDREAVEGEKFAEPWQDGVLAMNLMNALYDIDMPRKYKKDAKTRVHMLDNLNQTLKKIKEAGVQTVGLKQANFLDQDFKMLLGFVWCVILDFNIKGISVEDANARTGLLIWCRKKTKGYEGVPEINGFKKDWKNGNAFLALVDRHTTGRVDYMDMLDKSPEEKLDQAFSVCEDLGVPRLLEVGDLTEVDVPDDKAVMTYVSELFKLFSKEDIKDNAREHIAKFLNFQRNIDFKIRDYEQQFQECLEWLQAKTAHFTECERPGTQTACSIASDEYKTYLLEEKPQKLANVIEILDLFSDIQGELKINHRVLYQPVDDKDPSLLQKQVDLLAEAENSYVNSIRETRTGLLEQLDTDEGVSEDRLKEWNSAFDTFDVDKSGHLNLDEYKAALSAVGVSLTQEDLEENWKNQASESGFIERQQFMDYLTAFFSTSDDADSILKSMQVLGDPENPTDDMFAGMSQEDIDYLNSFAGEGGLAAAIKGVFVDQ